MSRAILRDCARLAIITFALGVALGQPLVAQELRGTIRDSSSGSPIPSAVVILLDAAGTTLGRNITNEQGEYRISLTNTIRRIRVLRIGFRPSEASVPTGSTSIIRLDIRMRSI